MSTKDKTIFPFEVHCGRKPKIFLGNISTERDTESLSYKSVLIKKLDLETVGGVELIPEDKSEEAKKSIIVLGAQRKKVTPSNGLGKT